MIQRDGDESLPMDYGIGNEFGGDKTDGVSRLVVQRHSPRTHLVYDRAPGKGHFPFLTREEEAMDERRHG
ncbi:hypothetical protein SSP24_48250 [Streptomyces spinoverrucosus]|uniref:Uncharacterized protein n=1 Tax=Streptomyces spinoverrucosus TaxID=284043 RepID=A0A4Y3VNB4_9ACTN|nr:hypothetical protein SSP24_48250 [Streptomyces spinoverrucosus]GHB80974.1 hypothetical protein GCM10010397_59780 [Streptomyces spinoverrucosus]